MIDESELLRLFHSDEQYSDGEIKDIAISIDDLKERGLSLDIKALVKSSVILDRAAEQASRNPDRRHTTFISEIVKKEVCDCTAPDEDDEDSSESGGITLLFEIKPTPLDANPAHASLFCIKKNKKRSFYVMARNKLKPIFKKKIVPLSTWSI